MTDNEIIKAWDILCKMDFFGGQRAGRELWNSKPIEIQNKDIADFSKDIEFLKDFINRQKAEVENLQQILYAFLDTRNGDLVHITEKELEIIKKPIKANAIKEFAELLHCHCENRINNPINQKIQPLTWAAAYEEFEDVVDNLVKEMVGDSE